MVRMGCFIKEFAPFNIPSVITVNLIIEAQDTSPWYGNKILFISKSLNLAHLMVQISFHGSNSKHIATSFKILNDVAVCTRLDLYNI